jgi:hypothetical protein
LDNCEVYGMTEIEMEWETLEFETYEVENYSNE